MGTPLNGMGRWIFRHRFWVAAFWGLLLCLGAIGAKNLPTVLLEGSGEISGSQSQRVDQILRKEFENPYIRSLLVAVKSQKYLVDQPQYQEWLKEATQRLEKLPMVAGVSGYLDAKDSRLCSLDGHTTLLMIGLKVDDARSEEASVPVVREALASLKTKILADDPQAGFAVTGYPAVTYDINQYNKHDGEVAEMRALPLTLIVLLLAFGALIAAGIPLLIGVAGTTIAMGAAYLLSHFLPLSNLLQNIVMMIGLAIGIDYSLLMVSRFREALRRGSLEDAVAEVVEKAGPAVLTSGLTVMIGLFGMTFAPLMELKSIGLGGSLVVVVSVLAAVTLLPAILGMVGPWIDAPKWLARPLQSARAEVQWRRLAEWVMKKPWQVLSATFLLILVLALPATQLRAGFSSSKWLPPAMEAQVGVDLLEGMGNSNAVFPIYLIVRSNDNRPILDMPHLLPLSRYAASLQADSRVGTVLSPLTLREDMGFLQYVLLYQNLDSAITKFPQIGQLFLNRDRTAALFQVIPSNALPLKDVQGLAHDLEKKSITGPFTLEVGGTPVYYNEFHSSLLASYPPVILFVLGVTLCVLFVAFRSYLLPLKAVILNLFSVAAGYGAVTMVFQFGWLKEIVGLPRPLDSIPLVIPMVIFCIVFGLSMDYEVFLLSRITESYEECGDNREATAKGLASTGSLITSAALIMVAVFGVFSWAEIAFIKIIGFGLTVAVLVDATLIRILMAPAFMRIADRWNWVPGHRIIKDKEKVLRS